MGYLQYQLVSRISEPSTVCTPKSEPKLSLEAVGPTWTACRFALDLFQGGAAGGTWSQEYGVFLYPVCRTGSASGSEGGN